MVQSSVVWSIENGDLGQNEHNVNEEINGRRPIHYAADFGQKDVVEYLVSKGADVNVTDSYGMTALLCAIFEGHVDVVKLLLSKGAISSGKAPDGRSYVECSEKAEIRQLLQNAGVL